MDPMTLGHTRRNGGKQNKKKTCAQWPRIQQTSVRLDQIEMTAGHTHTTCRPPVCVCDGGDKQVLPQGRELGGDRNCALTHRKWTSVVLGADRQVARRRERGD